MINCIAIDDEPLALKIITEFCKRLEITDVKVYTSPEKGMQAVIREEPDILFMDIEMGEDVSGLSLATNCPEKTCLIFTSAYPEYAIHGFDLNATDYLIKPFSFDRFQQAIERAQKKILIQNENQQHLIVKSGYKNVTIVLNEIYYIEAMDNYICIHLNNGVDIKSQTRMSTIAENLPHNKFKRIHKSYIISLSYVISFTSSKVVLAGLTNPLPIGRTYYNEFAEYFQHK
ncbi:MAG: LytTR family DNA-binding domain-containing protein [Bacteroidaceae bacterium]|nr:LytTR family DNA-binding domain-containing protein [Bacteroidaceae bacterium]